MSRYTNDPDLRAGGLPPRTGFLQKPFSGEQLRDALRSLDLDRSSPELILSNES